MRLFAISRSFEIGVVVATIAGGLVVAGCQRSGTPDAAEASTAQSSAGIDVKPRVTPFKPTRKTLTRYCEQPGQLCALAETPLFSKVGGYVRAVHVDIGDRVVGPKYEGDQLSKAGQVLAEIDAPELTQELAQKTASVEQANSEVAQAAAAVKVARAMSDSAAAMRDEVGASIERAGAEYDRWKSELARVTDLAARQAVTEKLVDETQSKLRAADAARKEASAKLRSADARCAETAALVEKAEADLVAAKAKVGVAEADRGRVASLLSFAQLRAPFDGIVAARHVETGQLVNTGAMAQPLLVVVDARIVRVYVDVPESDAALIGDDAEATVRLPSSGSDSFTGKVTRSAWVLNQATRTMRVEIDVPNADGRLRPGMYAHAKVKIAERRDVIVAPKTALMAAAGQTSVWRIAADGKLERRVVETGIEAGGEVEIRTGLESSDEIIGVNPGAFREGVIVERVAPKS